MQAFTVATIACANHLLFSSADDFITPSFPAFDVYTVWMPVFWNVSIGTFLRAFHLRIFSPIIVRRFKNRFVVVVVFLLAVQKAGLSLIRSTAVARLDMLR